jgi:hypothetical protein
MLGYGCNNAYCANNYISGGDYQIVVKGNSNVLENNIAYGPMACYIVDANDTTIRNNTFVGTSNFALRWIKVLTYDAGPLYSYIENNIFYAAAGCAYAVDIATVNNTYYGWLDYNCYFGGDINVIRFNSVGYSTIAALVAGQIWKDWREQNLDQYSIVANPQFVDAANGDFRLQTGSPCVNAGKPTVATGWTSIGAWQGEQVLDSDVRYRDRYN